MARPGRHHGPAGQTPWPGQATFVLVRNARDKRGHSKSSSIGSDFPSRRREKVSVRPSRRRLAWPLRRDNRHPATDCLGWNNSVPMPRSSDGTRWHSGVGSDNVVYIAPCNRFRPGSLCLVYEDIRDSPWIQSRDRECYRGYSSDDVINTSKNRLLLVVWTMSRN